MGSISYLVDVIPKLLGSTCNIIDKNKCVKNSDRKHSMFGL